MSLYLSRIEHPPPKGLLYPPHDRGNTRKREKKRENATLPLPHRKFGTLFGTLWYLFGDF